MPASRVGGLLLAGLLLAMLATATVAAPAPDIDRPSSPASAEMQKPRRLEVSHETASGHFEEIAVGHLGSGPAIVAVGPDDTVWVALARLGALGRYTNGRLDLFPLGKESRPVGVVVGTAENGYPGELWVAASFDNKIIRFDPVRGSRRDYVIEGDTSWPFNIAIHPDGGLWFTQRASGRLGRLDPESGAVEHFEPPTPSGGPAGLAIDPESGRIWFTESYADRIAYLDPAEDGAGGEIHEILLGDASTGLVSGPAGMAVAPDGSVYFAKLEGLLGRARKDASRPQDVELIELPPEARRPAGVAVGADGTVWAGALDGNMIVRYEPEKRHVTLFPIPTGAPDLEPSQPPFARTSRPFGIATDSRGHLWFSEQYAGQLAVLDTTPPSIDILWPNPKRPISGATTPLTLRLGERSGFDELTFEIDGVRVERTAAGRLDLSALAPGEHRLEVAARDRAGFRARAVRPFVYRPDHLALIEKLEAWQPGEADADAVRLRQDLLKIAGRMPRDRRAGLDAFEERLRAAGDVPGLDRVALLAQVEKQRGVRGARIEVALLDHPPYFKPRRLKLTAGDTVNFSYQPAMRGHELPKAVHQLEVRGGAETLASPKLRAGEGFEHTFGGAGVFEVVDLETSAERPASMRIEVRP